MQTASQITRVSSTQRCVDKTFTCTRSCNEVLKSLQTFTEVALDRTRNHVTTRVSHKTTHTCNLTHLGHVSTSTRVDHHVNRVEAKFFELFFHCLLNIRCCSSPDANFLATTLAVGDNATTELCLNLFGLLFVTVKNAALGSRSLDVVNRNSQT